VWGGRNHWQTFNAQVTRCYNIIISSYVSGNTVGNHSNIAKLLLESEHVVDGEAKVLKNKQF